jgi:DNA primase
MKQIPREVIDEVRHRNDIAEVIGSYLSLKNAGSRLKALCPFHKEKTPSFTVNPERQIYHCFGCGVGGDVIRFIQEYEKVDFPVALQMLADRAGMDLQFEESTGSGVNKRELFRVHEAVARLYHRILLEHPEGESGRTYLASRQLSPETVKMFQVGFAPDRFDTLARWAGKQGVSDEVMVEAGLMLRSDRRQGCYDRFRKRLMFPVRDEAGRVIGFSGRLIDPEDRGGKYVNSPETPLFHKSRVLFGIDQARREMAERRVAIVCEGQLDAIRCHEAGITNAVASQGTALTSSHAKIIKRYADEVVLVLDADAAGQKAALRSSEAFIAEELSVRVASLPEGEDPDSLIQKRGAEALLSCVREAVSALDFLINCAAASDDLKSEVGILRTSKLVQGLIRQAPGSVQRDRMIQQASERLGISPAALRRDLVRSESRSVRSADTEASAVKAVSDSYPKEEADLLQLLTLYSDDVFSIVADHLPPQHFSDPDCRLLFELLLERCGQSLLDLVPAERGRAQRLAARIQVADTKLRGKESDPARTAQDLVMSMWRRALKERLRLERDGESRLGIRSQLQVLDDPKKGWEHAVGFLVA